MEVNRTGGSRGTSLLTGVRQTSKLRAGSVLLADILLVAAAVGLLFPTGVLDRLAAATGGLVTPTLAVNLVILVVVGTVIMGGGAGLRPADVGLRRHQVLTGMVGALAFWALIQLVLAAPELFSTGNLQWSSRLMGRDPSVIAGALTAQLLGTAVHEEVVYRGFLIPQIFHQLQRRMANPRVAVAGAVVVASFAFAAMHIPNLIRLGIDPLPQLVIYVVSGIVYGLLWVFTGNLIFVIGVHALGNWNMALFESSLDAGAATFLGRVALVVVLGVLYGRKRSRIDPEKVS